ncbi:MAG: GSCFA domain-containing protein [Ferruginibacter sp.]
MNFHLEFSPKPFSIKIKHSDKLLLAGSCFTEHIGEKLNQHKFSVLENPNGILFNPVSICKSVQSYIDNKQYTAADLFQLNDSWNSWEHHSRFSAVDQNESLQKINNSQSTAHDFLKKADWLLLTLGSAFVYELDNKQVVANCHKVPADKFNKRLLSADEISNDLKKLIERLQSFNPGLKIIFTISPVRHLREGFVENNRSKATLIQAVHQLLNDEDRLFYFPAYELVIDDLRDYRFYAEDMVHPNYAATNYVWEKFIAACIDEPSKEIMKQVNDIRIAFNHKPFNPSSAEHKKFLQSYFEKTKLLAERLPYIDLQRELKYFSVESNV